MLMYCPAAHRGTPSCEVLMLFRGHDQIHESGFSYWTNGGPNAGDDLNFATGEEPTHWMPLPSQPGTSGDKTE